VYDPTLKEGELDYQKKTLELSFDLFLYPTTAFGAVDNILAGLEKTGKKETWGFKEWPLGGEAAVFVGRKERSVWGGVVYWKSAEEFTVEAALLNDKGKTIATGRGVLNSWVEKDDSRIQGSNDKGTITFTAKADDISDALTVKITKINGRDAAAVGRAGYMKIAAPGTEYKIGDTGPAGGIIFYTMGGSGWRYMEAAPEDISDAEWGADREDISGTETRTGSGKKNTERIVAKLKELGESGRAAQLCAEYELNGYGDWFLPSKDELDLMYKNLKAKSLGNFGDGTYWSSSQRDSRFAWFQSFGNGNRDNYLRLGRKSVRAVRAF
jgi:hypothetical protein